jgi:tagatose 1,6-diphosphate aldolase GatY/KbaY
MLKLAMNGGYAVGAFNAENAEMVWAVITAAEECRAPVIVQTTPGTLRYLGPGYFAGMVRHAAEEASVPVALHLDHGSNRDLAQHCIVCGYSSVMIDASSRPYDENVALSKSVCDAAHISGIPVEGELGAIGGREDGAGSGDTGYTDPKQAADFVERTGVSSLAIAVGTAHGFYKTPPALNFDIITAARNLVGVPLVLHGASGLSSGIVSRAVRLGIAKVNFATELRDAYTKTIREFLGSNADTIDPKKYGEPARAAVKELVKDKISACLSGGRI